jgi:hypothetical protein
MVKLDGGVSALLMYDIPEKSKLMPSAKLRDIALRVNKSCWLVQLAHVPEIPIEEWREVYGADVHLVQVYDSRTHEQMVEIGKRALSNDLGKMAGSLQVSIYKLREELAMLRPGDHEKLAKAKDRTYRQFRRASELADSAEEASALFMLSGEMKHYIEGLRATIKAKSAVYDGLVADAASTVSGEREVIAS